VTARRRPAAAERPSAKIYAVSDGRGETCEQVVRAALVQFAEQPYSVERRARVRTRREVQTLVRQAAREHAVIFYTLVGDSTRREMAEISRRLLVPTVDVLGPAFSALFDLFRRGPGTTPGLLYASDPKRYASRDAIEFALKHDDGQRTEDLANADVVLVGVSRSSKTSTCFYLAAAGVKAANVPLVPGVAVPRTLARLGRRKVIGLRVNVARLMTIREARAETLGIVATDPYLEEDAVAREVIEANRTMERHGWASLDVSYLAVEEIAREVLRLRGLGNHR